jgi:hypothetical protein
MIARMVDWMRRIPALGSAVRAVLWWGIALRGVLLTAMAVVWATGGNETAAWLMSGSVFLGGIAPESGTAPVPALGFGLFLLGGAALRWSTLRSMNEAGPSGPG